MPRPLEGELDMGPGSARNGCSPHGGWGSGPPPSAIWRKNWPVWARPVCYAVRPVTGLGFVPSFLRSPSRSPPGGASAPGRTAPPQAECAPDGTRRGRFSAALRSGGRGAPARPPRGLRQGDAEGRDSEAAVGSGRPRGRAHPARGRGHEDGSSPAGCPHRAGEARAPCSPPWTRVSLGLRQAGNRSGGVDRACPPRGWLPCQSEHPSRRGWTLVTESPENPRRFTTHKGACCGRAL